MEITSPFLEVADAIVEAGGRDLNTCYQCATCTGVCPWGWVSPLNMRRLIRLAQMGQEGYEGDDLWRCTTCGTCQNRCPRGVDILGLVRSIRTLIGEAGTMPKSLSAALGSVSADGNPWSGDRADRNLWAAEAVPRFDPRETEYLLFACCMPSYDPRARRAALAVIRILRTAGITVGVLGTQESCCGESVRRSGGEAIFQRVGTGNAELFRRAGVQRVLVLSPHCLHTFKHEYPALGTTVQVTHVVELIADLVRAGRLQLTKRLDRVVTYHDPCYLGRHNQVFEPPRELLRAIPGLELREMVRNREASLCCGGGGGRMWIETKVGERFSDLRIPEAIGAGASVLATACPYCINMLEASRLSLGSEDAIEVKDVAELVADALE